MPHARVTQWHQIQMTKLKVFCDLSADKSMTELLREGIAPHELVMPKQSAKTVLAQSGPDPALAEADIAFGQPDAVGVLNSRGIRWLQISSAGTRYDTPDFRRAASKRGLIVTNSSSVYGQPSAEHVLSFMFAQARQLPLALRTHCSSDSEAWRDLRKNSVLLKHQKVLILGYGAIGILLLPVLKALQMEVVGFRRRPKGNEGIPVINEQGLPEAPATDHVINLLPENAESRHFMSAERFGMMKPGAVFYNIGRGKTVDQEALAGALRSGHLAAAWLDVTEPEPLPHGHPLLSAPTCFMSPHTAGGHHDEHRNLVLHFRQNFRRFLANEPLQDRVM
jgi:phosphoglycerate dehydrogenase-like enzyme